MPRVLQIKGNGVIVFMIHNIHLLFIFTETKNPFKILKKVAEL
jgi:hypothetical protein